MQRRVVEKHFVHTKLFPFRTNGMLKRFDPGMESYSMLYFQCSTQTHQLALDMQLSLLSPILVWFWFKKPLLAILILFNLHILSFGVRFYFTTNYQLSLFIFHGIS